MTEQTKGQTISACFEFVAKCGQEIHNLAETLTTLFNDELDRRGSTLPFAAAGKWNKAVWSNDDLAEWTCIGVAYSLPLKRGKGNFKTERWLTIQANATGKYLLPESKEPVLHVYLWEDACDFDETFNAFPYAADGEMEATVEMERLVRYGDGRMGAESEIHWLDMWAFCVRLTDLQTPSDLIRLVVQPALKLMMGRPVEEALPDSLLKGGLMKLEKTWVEG